jgi:hypothetical protein
MPNHVTNIINAADHILAFMVGDKDEDGDRRLFDFNKVIPMPEGLQVTAEGRATSLAELLTGKIQFEAPSTDDAMSENGIHQVLAAMKASTALQMLQNNVLKEFDDDGFENFLQILRNCREHGYPTWYEWSSEHWGTKWNAYDFAEVEGGVQFDTAWGAPHPVIEKLVSMFPRDKITHRWADEDIGANQGFLVYEDGEVEKAEIADPVDFALMIKGYGREDYWQNPETGLWEYNEEGEEAV